MFVCRGWRYALKEWPYIIVISIINPAFPPYDALPNVSSPTIQSAPSACEVGAHPHQPAREVGSHSAGGAATASCLQV